MEGLVDVLFLLALQLSRSVNKEEPEDGERMARGHLEYAESMLRVRSRYGESEMEARRWYQESKVRIYFHYDFSLCIHIYT